MSFVPHYDVSIYEEIGLKEVDEGQEYTPVQEAWWSGDADSPETAEENARAAWRERYHDDPPDSAEVKITPGPLVCARCEGRGKLTRDAPGIDPGPGWPLGSSKERTCPECNGTGNITQRR
jgi:hypothetical protein